MPRLPPSLFLKAFNTSPHLATLLPACRDLPSASNELRWIREHVARSASRASPEARIARLCQQRGRGVPLQYVLGSQPFGSLDIKCKPGVLIPRAETEAYTIHLAQLIKDGTLLAGNGSTTDDGLKVIDFCTGTGCIPLLLYDMLQISHGVQVQGIDISLKAMTLARENLARNVQNGSLPPPTPDRDIVFKQSDLFDDVAMDSLAAQKWDVMVSNPPYVSRDVWRYGQGQMGHSVQKYEPKLALVPGDNILGYPGCNHEDIFYARLLDVAARLRPRVLLFEVGDEPQALRVLRLAQLHQSAKGFEYEIWRDWPDISPRENESSLTRLVREGDSAVEVETKGSGNVRSILIKTSYG